MNNFENKWQERIASYEKNAVPKMDADKIWDKVEKTLPEEKTQKFAWLSHIAAMIIGVLIAGIIAAFLLKNNTKTTIPQTEYITQKEVDTVYLEKEMANATSASEEDLKEKSLAKTAKFATTNQQYKQATTPFVKTNKNVICNNDKIAIKPDNNIPKNIEKELPKEIIVQNQEPKEQIKQLQNNAIAHQKKKVIHINDIVNTQQFANKKTFVDKLLNDTKDFENTNPIAFLK